MNMLSNLNVSNLDVAYSNVYVAGICVVTDGSLGVAVTDSNRFDLLMTQLRNSTIACSFLKMGQSYCPRTQFGHVPHVELLQFIASATFGSYFSTCPDLVSIVCDYSISYFFYSLLAFFYFKAEFCFF